MNKQLKKKLSHRQKGSLVLVLFVIVTFGLAACARSCREKRGIEPKKTIIEKPTVHLDLELDEIAENIDVVISQADSAVMYLMSIYQEAAKDSLTMSEAYHVIMAREKLKALEGEKNHLEAERR